MTAALVKTAPARREWQIECNLCQRKGPIGWRRPDVADIGWSTIRRSTQRVDVCKECQMDKPKPGERWEEVGRRRPLCLTVLDVTDTEVSLLRRMAPPMVLPLAEFVARWKKVVTP